MKIKDAIKRTEDPLFFITVQDKKTGKSYCMKTYSTSANAAREAVAFTARASLGHSDFKITDVACV